MGKATVRGLTLDAGALIAYERGDARMRALAPAASRGRRVTVPSPALAQAWRGPRTPVSRLLAHATVEPLTRELALRAGELLARTGTSDVVDAAIAASAASRGDIVVTSDPDDLLVLAEDLPAIRIWAI